MARDIVGMWTVVMQYTLGVNHPPIHPCLCFQNLQAPVRVMTPGGWYLVVFVTTFLYFYIYAVNYMRG